MAVQSDYFGRRSPFRRSGFRFMRGGVRIQVESGAHPHEGGSVRRHKERGRARR